MTDVQMEVPHQGKRWTRESSISMGLAFLILGGFSMAAVELRSSSNSLTGLEHDMAAMRGNLQALQASSLALQERIAENTAKLSALQADIQNLKERLRGEERKK